MFCWRKKPTYSDVMIPDVALSVFYPTQLVVDGQTYGGETVTIHVYMFTQGHSKMCCFFHSTCKIYLPYSGFYCGIIQSGIIIQYCTILFSTIKERKKNFKNKSEEKNGKLKKP